MQQIHTLPILTNVHAFFSTESVCLIAQWRFILSAKYQIAAAASFCLTDARKRLRSVKKGSDDRILGAQSFDWPNIPRVSKHQYDVMLEQNFQSTCAILFNQFPFDDDKMVIILKNTFGESPQLYDCATPLCKSLQAYLTSRCIWEKTIYHPIIPWKLSTPLKTN